MACNTRLAAVVRNLKPGKCSITSSRLHCVRLPLQQHPSCSRIPINSHLRSFHSSVRSRRELEAHHEAPPQINRAASKLFKDADEAVSDLKSGSMVFSAGFGLCGTAGKLHHDRDRDIVPNLNRNHNKSDAQARQGIAWKSHCCIQ